VRLAAQTVPASDKQRNGSPSTGPIIPSPDCRIVPRREMPQRSSPFGVVLCGCAIAFSGALTRLPVSGAGRALTIDPLATGGARRVLGQTRLVALEGMGPGRISLPSAATTNLCAVLSARDAARGVPGLAAVPTAPSPCVLVLNALTRHRHPERWWTQH
jgi:hypothetical protein